MMPVILGIMVLAVLALLRTVWLWGYTQRELDEINQTRVKR